MNIKKQIGNVFFICCFVNGFMGWYMGVKGIPYTLNATIYVTGVALLLYSIGLGRKREKILSFIMSACLLFWVFANGAYFDVFYSFIPWNRVVGSDVPASFLIDFYTLNPWYTYTLGIVILSLWGYMLKKNSTNKRTKIQYISIAIIMLCLSTLIIFQKTHPKKSWWDKTVQATDLGIIGSQLGEAYTFFKEDNVSKVQGITITREYKKEEGSIPDVGDSPHVLIYQMESVPSWPIDLVDSPMPFLRELQETSPVVDTFFANSCSTINAELSILCSQIAPNGDPITTKEEKGYTCLPEILKGQHGYKTVMYHANNSAFWNREELFPRWGIDDLRTTPLYEKRDKDKLLIRDALKELQEADTPILSYIIGVDSHSPHDRKYIEVLKKEKGFTEDFWDGEINNPLIETSKVEKEDIGDWFWFLKVVDNNIKFLIEEAKEKEVLDNTIIIIVGDHRYYGATGEEESAFLQYNQIPFVVLLPKNRNSGMKNIASHIDIAPTILSLINKNYQSPFKGTSIYSTNHPESAKGICLGEYYEVNKGHIIKRNSETNQEHIIERNIAP